MENCPEDATVTVNQEAEELFDILSKTFVPNPWIMRNQSYSTETKNKLAKEITSKFSFILYLKLN